MGLVVFSVVLGGHSVASREHTVGAPRWPPTVVEHCSIVDGIVFVVMV